MTPKDSLRARRALLVLIAPAALVLLAACSDESFTDDGGGAGGGDGGVGAADTLIQPDTQPAGLPVLGGYKHAASSVKVSVVVDSKDGLMGPRDLAFHPGARGQLWIVNQTDESVVILGDATGANAQARNIKRRVLSGHHFLAQPSGIAFGTPNGYGGKYNLATIHETDRQTQGPNGTPADFMGPTLYTSDLSVFDAGHGGHLDMMHNTPNGMGIAWGGRDNIYWVFDGAHSSITRYDFRSDHGPGGSYHGDGSIRRYAAGKVKRVAGVPSHLEFVGSINKLFIADTGNNRIAILDPTSGQTGSPVSPNYDGGEQIVMNNADLRTFIEGSKYEMKKPSGLAVKDGVMYVTDNETSRITAFDLQGNRLDWLDLGKPAGSIMGIEVGPDGKLYVVDFKANQILRIEAK